MYLPDDIDLSPYMEPLPLFKEVKPPWKFLNEVVGEFNRNRVENYPRLPWSKTHEDFCFRPGEVSIIFGFSSHGKSAVCGQCTLSLMAQGQTCGMASLEMPPRSTLASMAKQASCETWPDEEKIKDFMRWADKKLWVFNYQGIIDPITMTAVIRYTCDKYRVNFFIVDNLMKCVRGQDDYNGEKDFIDQLIAIAKYYSVHIIVVAHVRKGDEFRRPSRYDIRGSSTISDQVDNCVSVWRNKDLERRLREGEYRDGVEYDTIIGIDKQRQTGIEGEYGLYYDRPTGQFVGHVAENPIRYLEF